jgi:hypothetical protein
VLPESVRQHLLVVIAQEQERAAREPAAPPQEEGEETASQAQPTTPGGTDPPQHRLPSRAGKAPQERAAALGKAGSPHKAGHPEPAASAEPFVPLPRRPPRAPDRQAQPPVTSVPAPSLAVQAEAPTEPFMRIPALGHGSPSAPVNPGDTQAAPPPERPAPVPDTPTAAVPDTRAAAVSASSRRVAGQRTGRRQRRPGRRYRMAGVLLSVAVLITAGSLALTLYGHSASAVAPRGHRQHPAPGGDPVTRDQAAAWVASQVARTTLVSADPAMCRVLESYGFPARNLYELGPEATNPLRSTVIVATPTVRAQFGTLLSSVYAPAVLASFGSGGQRVDVREIAPHGAAAYRSMLAADLAARKSTGAELLRSNRINGSPTARKQLSAGQVDSRLEITVAAMAAKRPVYIVAFNSFAPGADADMPLRFADLVQASSGYLARSRSVTPAFVRSMVAFLRGPAPFRPLRVGTVRLAGGHTVLRIEFAAPSPLGLFGSP